MNDDALAAYEDMKADVLREFEELQERMESLRSNGKTKTATYQQLFARKMTLAAFLDIYRKHGLL